MTTCQICGRQIKLVGDRIAHHGYQQPWRSQGSGARTSSCPGARHLPYEVSRVLIPQIRRGYEEYRTKVETSVATWLAEPPPEIKVIVRDGWLREKSRFTRQRPEGFDPQNLRGSSMFHSYEAEYAARLRTMRNDAKALTEAIKFLDERYVNWRAP